MDQLGLPQHYQYLAAFKELENQRISLIYEQQQIQAQNQFGRQRNQEMEEKIQEDQIVIQHLNEQINNYKQAIKQFKSTERINKSMGKIQVEGRPSFSKSLRENKENICEHLEVPLFPNLQLTKSIEHDTTIASFKSIEGQQ